MGSEEKGKLGYDFVVKEGMAYRVDIHKVVGKIGNQERVVNELVSKMMDRMNPFDMASFLNDYKVPPDSVSMYGIDSQITSAKSTYTVHFFIKDSVNRVYIPGSSIKGAIRTYTAASKLLQNKKGKRVEDVGEEIFDLKKSFEQPWLELFQQNLKRRDPLIRDAKPTKSISDVLTLSTIEIHTERGGTFRRQQGKIYGEFVKPGVEFDIEFGRIERNKLHGILTNVDAYCKKIGEMEEAFYSEYGKEENYQHIADFYKSSIRSSGDKEYIFRIGMGSSFLCTSLLPVLKVLGYKNAEEIFKKVLRGRRSPLAITVPDSRKLTSIGGSLYPIGWVKLTLQD
ncbi:MAG: type III-A CRISPR-associated RAMP protein Csm5 [Thermoplasmata archaeon]